MNQKLKKHKYITKTGLIVLGIIVVILYLQALHIISTEIYVPTISKMLNYINGEFTHKVLNFVLIYPPLVIFYIIAPIDVFRLVYKRFRKDIFDY
ncbi:TPA: hypothetical protein QHS31_002733 [Staphylococcus aureus]|nr:hypothetical protein [Staphylococcus aureus]